MDISFRIRRLLANDGLIPWKSFDPNLNPNFFCICIGNYPNILEQIKNVILLFPFPLGSLCLQKWSTTLPGWNYFVPLIIMNNGSIDDDCLQNWLSLQWLSVPFAWYNPKVDFNKPDLDLVGEIKSKDLLSYIDYALLLVFGGIPWQVYFQRVLSSKSASQAQILSYVAAFGCFIMAIPPVIIGMVARATGTSNIFGS